MLVAYVEQICLELARDPSTEKMSPKDHWQQCQQAIKAAAEEVLGFSQSLLQNR